MNMVRFNIHNSREGILTVSKSQLTCISDQLIQEGDAILHPQYTRITGEGVSTFFVDIVEEERPSSGEWKDQPSTFRRISFSKKVIDKQIMKDAGYLMTEEVTENGKRVEKMFLKI